MSALIFAILVNALAGIPIDYGVEMYLVAMEDGVSPAKMAAVVYSEHRSSRDYEPPYGESDNGAMGMFQMVDTWRRWSNKEYGWEITKEEFQTDPYVSIMIASKVILYFEKRHAKHADSVIHTEEMHWKCGNTARDYIDAGLGEEESPRCISSTKKLSKEIETFEAMWRLLQPISLALTITMSPERFGPEI